MLLTSHHAMTRHNIYLYLFYSILYYAFWVDCICDQDNTQCPVTQSCASFGLPNNRIPAAWKGPLRRRFPQRFEPCLATGPSASQQICWTWSLSHNQAMLTLTSWEIEELASLSATYSLAAKDDFWALCTPTATGSTNKNLASGKVYLQWMEQTCTSKQHVM